MGTRWGLEAGSDCAAGKPEEKTANSKEAVQENSAPRAKLNANTGREHFLKQRVSGSKLQLCLNEG